jgi:putative transposase
MFGVKFVVSDDHEGLRRAIREVLPSGPWQRCYVHFLRKTLDHLPRKPADDCLQELRWIYDPRELVEVRRDIAAYLAKWQAKHDSTTFVINVVTSTSSPPTHRPVKTVARAPRR